MGSAVGSFKEDQDEVLQMILRAAAGVREPGADRESDYMNEQS